MSAPPRSRRLTLRMLLLGFAGLLGVWWHGTTYTYAHCPDFRSELNPRGCYKKLPRDQREEQVGVGDRVKLVCPIRRSNDGRSYFNEGAGTDVPPHLRDIDEDE